MSLIPLSGFYYDRQTSILYYNRKPIERVTSAAEHQKFRLHPYGKFLSYEGERSRRLYYESWAAWHEIRGFPRFGISSPRSFRVDGPLLAHDENFVYYLGRTPDKRHVDLGDLVLPEIPVGTNFRVLSRCLVAMNRVVYFCFRGEFLTRQLLTFKVNCFIIIINIIN
jgi:hypothetical protein